MTVLSVILDDAQDTRATDTFYLKHLISSFLLLYLRYCNTNLDDTLETRDEDT